MSIFETRHDRENRDAIREDNRIARKYGLSVMIGAYCPICHYFNFLTYKSKDGRDICESCCKKERK